MLPFLASTLIMMMFAFCFQEWYEDSPSQILPMSCSPSSFPGKQDVEDICRQISLLLLVLRSPDLFSTVYSLVCQLGHHDFHCQPRFLYHDATETSIEATASSPSSDMI